MSHSPRAAQLPLGFIPGSRARLDNFVAGGNAEILQAVAGQASTLYLYGVSGTGKSHLLQASCRQAAERGERALYLPLRDLMAQSTSLLQGLEQLQLLALDDVDALAGYVDWQRALVALLDQLRVAGARLLFAASAPPQSLKLELADLNSRLGWALRYGLKALDDDGRQQLLTRRAAERGLVLAEDVARYLLQRSPRDPAGLLQLLDRLDTASLATRRHLTIPLVREVLQQG